MQRPEKPVKPYYYYDTPEGQDVIKKLWYALKPAALATFAIGTTDVVLYSKPKTYLGGLSRYLLWSVPFIGGTTAAVLTSSMLCSLRKKDDEWNWFAGGVAIGTTIGALTRNLETGIACSAIFGTIGYGKKYCLLNGIIITPPLDQPRMHGTLRAVRHDMSLLPDATGEWKKKFQQSRN